MRTSGGGNLRADPQRSAATDAHASAATDAGGALKFAQRNVVEMATARTTALGRRPGSRGFAANAASPTAHARGGKGWPGISS